MTTKDQEQTSLLSRLQTNLGDLYKQYSKRNEPTAFDDPTSFAFSDWIPTVDITENRKRFLITVDVPGVDPNDIEVSMENGFLSIAAERKVEKEESDDSHRLMECSYGAFERRFRLPETADADKISAKNRHGVLTVIVEKKKVTKSNRIKID